LFITNVILISFTNVLYSLESYIKCREKTCTMKTLFFSSLLAIAGFAASHADPSVHDPVSPMEGCDPDYGWLPGVDGTKCYMIIKDNSNMPNCPATTYYGLTWFEAMACCVANHGVMAEVVSQEEQDFIKNMLVIVNGQGTKSAWWLGGSDLYSEGDWSWNSGQQFSFTNWHEGEPNNAGQEDCVSMSSQEGYMWEDLDCNTGYHSDIPHYTVCMKMLQ